MDVKMAPNNKSKTGWPHFHQAREILLECFSFIWDDPAEILIFYRGACTFRSIFPILTKPSILDISAPFAISGLFIQIEQVFDIFVTHTKPKFLTRRNHRVTVLLALFVNDSEYNQSARQ